jgi:hypothetical protein
MNCGGPIVVGGSATVDATVEALVGLAEVTLGVLEAADLAAEVDVHDVNTANITAPHAQDRRRTARPPITFPCCTNIQTECHRSAIGHDREGRIPGDHGYPGRGIRGRALPV